MVVFFLHGSVCLACAVREGGFVMGRGVACVAWRGVSRGRQCQEGVVGEVWVLRSGHLVLPWPGSLRPEWHLDTSRQAGCVMSSFCSSSLYIFPFELIMLLFIISNTFSYYRFTPTKENLLQRPSHLSQVCASHHAPAKALFSFVHLVLCRSRLAQCVYYSSATLAV